MSEQTAAVKPIHQIPLMHVRIAGKIQHTRRGNGIFYTVVVSPARDEYSHPSRVEIRSRDRLGQNDDVINVICQLSGSVREFNYRDKNTGESMTGFDARHYLEVIG